ncbi:hypothetical protein ACQ0P8_16225 (plasmid) [Halodesulfovibrio aestuarii]|uniref:Uncharacterized protein n=1 Tax=Halodesulfovibrio aestuarii TaxID=126333 RepID=A0A8G2CC62_9BACT|nr:hypothetical protein [Halodesulfovibrio aestuarii]SHJ72570.1 hypothetical protein SAMN05660830_03093 [Halodesulfovibrio aestuarii]
MSERKEKRGGADRGQGRRALPEDQKGKQVKCTASGVLLGMSGKQVREAAMNWVNYCNEKETPTVAPDLKAGDSVSVRIETHDSFKHESTHVVVDPIQRIDGAWLVGVQIYGKGVVMVPASEVEKKA